MLCHDPMDKLMDAVDWLSFHGPWLPGERHVTHIGWLTLGQFHFQVYTLNNGERCFDADSVHEQMS